MNLKRFSIGLALFLAFSVSTFARAAEAPTPTLPELQTLQVRLSALAIRSNIAYTRLKSRGVNVAIAQDELAVARETLVTTKGELEEAANPTPRLPATKESLAKIALSLTNARGHIIQSLILAKSALLPDQPQNQQQ